MSGSAGSFANGLSVAREMLDISIGVLNETPLADVAALFAADILRRNRDSVVIPFDTEAYDARIDPSDSILSLSERLAKYGGGGTDCAIPLRVANSTYRDRQFAGAVLVSDCESWAGTGRYGSTGVMTEWQRFVANKRKLLPQAPTARGGPKMVCIDIQPYGTAQAPGRDDRHGRIVQNLWRTDEGHGVVGVHQVERTALGGLNIGGFSDAVFNVVASYLSDDGNRFVTEVESVEL